MEETDLMGACVEDTREAAFSHQKMLTLGAKRVTLTVKTRGLLITVALKIKCGNTCEDCTGTAVSAENFWNHNRASRS